MIDDVEQVREALKDWVHTYAPELFDESCVAKSRNRIARDGTIGYISRVITLLEGKVLMDGWKSITEKMPPIRTRVLFICVYEDSMSDVEVGEWTGEKTAGNGIIMDYGEDDDWLPCTHWMPLPAEPDLQCREEE